jgi:hypothetical protein
VFVFTRRFFDKSFALVGASALFVVIKFFGLASHAHGADPVSAGATPARFAC